MVLQEGELSLRLPLTPSPTHTLRCLTLNTSLLQPPADEVLVASYGTIHCP